MFPRYRQCCTTFGKVKEECRYSIPSRRIGTRETYRDAGNGTRHILKSALRYSPPVDFRLRIPRPCPRLHSLLEVTVDSYARRPPANEAKTGNSRGRSRRVSRKGTLSLPRTSSNVPLERPSTPVPRKAIYLEKPERTLNGFPFQRYYAFLFNVKLAYRCGARLSHPLARVNRLEETLFLWGRKHESTEFPSTTGEVLSHGSIARVGTRCMLLRYCLSCESLEAGGRNDEGGRE